MTTPRITETSQDVNVLNLHNDPKKWTPGGGFVGAYDQTLPTFRISPIKKKSHQFTQKNSGSRTREPGRIHYTIFRKKNGSDHDEYL